MNEFVKAVKSEWSLGWPDRYVTHGELMIYLLAFSIGLALTLRW